MDEIESPIIPGRNCDTCTMCCKILSIKDLEKPQGQWCSHCNIGKGCKIYDLRPEECKTFYCGYLSWVMVNEWWFPAKCKMVIVSELDGNRIAVHVDPARPNAWKEEPYYSEIKEWACRVAGELKQVVVCIRNRAIVILPDEDVDLGPIGDDERIVCGEVLEKGRLVLRAMKLKVDDPRIAGMEDGVPYSALRRP